MSNSVNKHYFIIAYNGQARARLMATILDSITSHSDAAIRTMSNNRGKILDKRFATILSTDPLELASSNSPESEMKLYINDRAMEVLTKAGVDLAVAAETTELDEGGLIIIANMPIPTPLDQ